MMNPQAPDALAMTLLLVDDDDIFRARLARAFEARGLQVWQAADVAQGLATARAHDPELAVVDLRMTGERSGLELVRELVAHSPHIRVVMLTGYGSIATAVETAVIRNAVAMLIHIRRLSQE